jgi:hypothetical protein
MRLCGFALHGDEEIKNPEQCSGFLLFSKIIQTTFHNGQHSGVQKYRAKIEEMAIQHTGQQHCHNGQTHKQFFAGALL